MASLSISSLTCWERAIEQFTIYLGIVQIIIMKKKLIAINLPWLCWIVKACKWCWWAWWDWSNWIWTFFRDRVWLFVSDSTRMRWARWAAAQLSNRTASDHRWEMSAAHWPGRPIYLRTRCSFDHSNQATFLFWQRKQKYNNELLSF